MARDFDPDALRKMLLWEEPTEELLRSMPEDVAVIWDRRPSPPDFRQAKFCTIVRSILIASAFISASTARNELGSLLAVLAACYESAYTTLRNDKMRIDHLLRQDQYMERVDAFLVTKYPRYKPPSDFTGRL